MDLHCFDLLARLGLALTPEQLWAFAYLERRGQRFLIDFGWANAVEKANGFLSVEYMMFGKRILH